MLTAILISLAVVFVAELGDKSQLITMTYALRHRWWVVLSGVAIAATLVHGLSVAIGHFLGLTLPERPIAFAGAIAFLLFAVWTWREGRSSADDDVQVSEPRFVVFAIVSSFVLAELGDKTMLATVTLASDHNWAGVWIGATVGMVLADGVAIAAGALLHKRLPAGFLHSLASVLFLVFGLWLLFDSALGLRWVAIGVTGSVLVGVGIVALVRFDRQRNAAPATPASTGVMSRTERPSR
jgi:Ca2+/H+ antiporter, TMEM165/GDT1 family